jgi:hypothetical protein
LRFLLQSAALPVLTAFALGVVRGGWRGVASEALLLNAGVLTLVAPVAGVLVARSGPRSGAALRAVSAPALFLTTSALVCGTGWGYSPEALRALAASHATLAAAALALAALGALCASALSHELDAAALGVALALAVSLGVLGLGPAAGELPGRALRLILLANPVAATANAAGIDLLHSGFLYDLTPLARRQIEHPSWPASTLTFLGVALASGAGAVRLLRARARPPR